VQNSLFYISKLALKGFHSLKLRTKNALKGLIVISQGAKRKYSSLGKVCFVELTFTTSRTKFTTLNFYHNLFLEVSSLNEMLS